MPQMGVICIIPAVGTSYSLVAADRATGPADLMTLDLKKRATAQEKMNPVSHDQLQMVKSLHFSRYLLSIRFATQ